MNPPAAWNSYDHALDRLEVMDRRLALAAAVVPIEHPEAPAVADEILTYAAHHFGGRDILATYVRRAQQLSELQQRFDADPRPETLGAPHVRVDRDVYDLSLLLSIAFTNHRFEIMRQLDAFLVGCCRGGSGRIASIGTGTGYELRRMALRLPDAWSIESYDIEPLAQAQARAFLDYFDVSRAIHWGREFPLTTPPAQFHGRYDAIVMCELLEHLDDPQQALQSVRQCLAPGGRVFATMAINIAQEDHVFLYPDIESCRAQVQAAGYVSESEWITPQTTVQPPADREASFRKGNYVATLRPLDAPERGR